MAWVMPGQVTEERRLELCTEKIARNPSRKRVGEHIQALQSFVAELDTASDVLPVASLCERANEAIDAGNLFRFAAAIVGNVLLKPSHAVAHQERVTGFVRRNQSCELLAEARGR